MSQQAFGLLGPLEVRLDGRLVAIGSRKQRVLLCALLATPDRVVPVDTLVALLWGDEPPASVAVTLRSVASRLRNALGSAGEHVQAHDGGYVARLDPAAIDAHRFEDLAARGRALLADDRPDAAMAVLTRASALWRGRPFADVGEAGPLRPVVERLDAVRRDLVEDLVAGHLATGDPAAALALLGPHLAADPLREHARGLHMLALYRSGRQTEALAAFRALRATLRDELGVDPHPDLCRLHQQILRQDPALTPVRRAASHLPAALTPLVGRDGERSRLRALLPTARLVTLTGVGGVGKTRLGLQVAADVLADYPDGVRLIELGPVPDPGRVAAQFTAAFGVSEDALYGQRLLAVVDNCEHLVGAAAVAVDRLLRAVPGLTVLATSRVPLGIGGEVLWPVPPLSLPPPDVDDPVQLAGSDAVTLFCQRARATQAGFGVTADNAAAVAEICRRLDGLPLALELAASRLRALSSAQLAARLGDRFRLLTAGDRTAPARHRTLEATIDWSYRLLTPVEQAALCALTVFPAGLTSTPPRPSPGRT
jgi:DNA-binding SARP family transcriptional activator